MREAFNQAQPVPLQVARDLTIVLPIAEKFASQSAIFLRPAAFDRAARHSPAPLAPARRGTLRSFLRNKAISFLTCGSRAEGCAVFRPRLPRVRDGSV